MLGYDGVSASTRVMCTHGSFTESIFNSYEILIEMMHQC